MDQFHSFSKLPEAIRLQIWTHVANFPRVVGTCEIHDHTEYVTHAISTTRPPAVLGVCREARSLALTIYKPILDDIRTKDTDFDRPIYVNPEVDTIYRGKEACRQGDAFRVRGRNLVPGPVCGARTLAVDTIALGVLRKPDLNVNLPVPEIVRCARKGIREVMVVVGNDDDLSEVTLVPFDTPLEERSAREQKAFMEVCSLRRSVER